MRGHVKTFYELESAPLGKACSRYMLNRNRKFALVLAFNGDYSCCIRVRCELMCRCLKLLMGFFEALPQVVGLLQWGWSSGWFGLACPAHCQGSWVLLGLAFLSGISVGGFLAFATLLWIFPHLCHPSTWTSASPHPPPPGHPPSGLSPAPAAPEPQRPRHLRLRGYLVHGQ